MAASIWEIRKLRPAPQGTRRAFFTICCPPLKINHIAFHHDGEKSWIEMPMQPVIGAGNVLTRDSRGHIARRVIVDFVDKEIKATVTSWAIAEVERRLSLYLQDVAAQQAFTASEIKLTSTDEN